MTREDEPLECNMTEEDNRAYVEMAVRTSQSFAAVLDDRPSPMRLSVFTAMAARANDATLGMFHIALPPPTPICCTEGCHDCCHLRVVATQHEVCTIAWALRLRPDREQIAARAQDARKRVEGLDDTARALAKVRCPLLGDDNRCAVYAVRPMACRGWNSMSREACEGCRPKVKVPVYGHQYWMYNMNAGGAMVAFKTRGYGWRPVELIEGLVRALEPGVVEEFCNKGTPFQDIEQPIGAEEEQSLDLVGQLLNDPSCVLRLFEQNGDINEIGRVD